MAIFNYRVWLSHVILLEFYMNVLRVFIFERVNEQ